MVFLFNALVACTSTPSSTPTPPTPVAVEAPAPAEAPPAGSIGGEPILPKPVVVGGIENEAVVVGIDAHLDAIKTCYETERAKSPKLAGKVLVKFNIAKDGTVSEAATKSTSLRNEAAEDCINDTVAKASFPPLQGGKIAIVQYPFVFP